VYTQSSLADLKDSWIKFFFVRGFGPLGFVVFIPVVLDLVALKFFLSLAYRSQLIHELNLI
jgi:hypothetical protein